MFLPHYISDIPVHLFSTDIFPCLEHYFAHEHPAIVNLIQIQVLYSDESAVGNLRHFVILSSKASN